MAIGKPTFSVITPPRPSVGHLRALSTVIGAGIVVALVFLFMSASTVQAGYVGVVLTFGRVEPGTLGPGFHLIVPVAQQIVQIDTRVLPHTFKEIDAASQELQSVKLTGTMNYHLDPARAGELYQTVGLDFATKVIDPAFNDFIKEVVPTYRVTEILTKRDEIRTRAKERLGANLQRYGIIVDDIYISDISFSPEYQAAIEQKQTAQQMVETEQQILNQKQIQAQQAVVEAKGKSDATVAAAQGEAQANQIRTASISPELVDYLRWQRWDGRLPMVSGSSTTPFIQLPTEFGTTPPTATAVPTAAPTTVPTPAPTTVPPSASP